MLKVKAEMKTCAACGNAITRNQNLYEIKLDNEEIVYSHGYPCVGRHQINRKKPILPPDWWIRQVPNTSPFTDEEEQRIREIVRAEIRKGES